MKKRLVILLCWTMVMTLLAAPVLAAPIVNLDGQQLSFDVAPVIEDGRTLVPLRGIFEAMGASVEWDSDTQTATAVKDSTTVVVGIGSVSPTVNGIAQTIDVPAKIINGRTFAPLRFVCEAFGGTVAWDTATGTAIVTSADNTAPAQTSGAYVGSIKSDKYHLTSCRYAERIKEENQVYFDTEEAAVAAGYEPCGVCKP